MQQTTKVGPTETGKEQNLQTEGEYQEKITERKK
jgi:hypothetical protein